VSAVLDFDAPGTLKPRAITVLRALEMARDRTLTEATLARKLCQRHRGDTIALLSDMRALGLIQGYGGVWTLALHLAPRPSDALLEATGRGRED